MFTRIIKYLFIFILLLATRGFSLMAQGREFGIRAGVLAATTYNNGEQVEDILGGLYGGVYLGRPIGSTFFTSWITGLDYFQNGYRSDNNNYRRLHYLGVPMAFRFHFGPIYLQPGVSFNLKVSERFIVDGENVFNIYASSLVSDTKSSRFDLPIVVAAGVKLLDLILEARYYIGWMDINQGNQNLHLQLGLAYTF